MGALSLCHEISNGEAFIVPTAAQRALPDQPLISKSKKVLDGAFDGGFKDGERGLPRLGRLTIWCLKPREWGEKQNTW